VTGRWCIRDWNYSPTILDLCTGWRWVVGFTPLPVYPRGKGPCIHCLGVLVGSRASLDTVEYRKIYSLCRESSPGRTVRRHTNCALVKMQSVQKSTWIPTKKVKMPLQQAVEAHRFVKCRGSHIF
jgi:hypothetical protein